MIVCPVRNAAAGDARNTAAPATSSGVPQRLSGVDSAMARDSVVVDAGAERRLDPAGRQDVDAHARRDRSRERLAEREHAALHRGEQLRVGARPCRSARDPSSC